MSELSNLTDVKLRGNIKVIENIFFKFFFMLHMAMILDFDAKEFLVEDELSKSLMTVHEFLECGGLAGEVALSLVLLVQEVAGKVVHKL